MDSRVSVGDLPSMRLLVITISLAFAACSGSDTSATAPSSPTTEPSGPETSSAWTAEKTRLLMERCDAAFTAVDEATLRACYDAKFKSDIASNVFSSLFRDEVGPDVHVEDAKEFKSLFTGKIETLLLLSTPTRAVQIHLQVGSFRDGFPIVSARGKLFAIAVATLSVLDDRGRLVSELIVGDQSVVGNQTGMWESPMKSSPFPTWAKPISIAATGSASEEQNLEIVRATNRAFAEGDFAAAAAFYADSSRGWEPMNVAPTEANADQPKEVNRAERRIAMENGRALFASVQEKVMEEFSAGDWVVVLSESTVVLSDAGLPGMPDAAGKSISVTELRIVRLEKGLIREGYNFYNALSIQEQLGIFDASAAKELIKKTMAEIKAGKSAE